MSLNNNDPQVLGREESDSLGALPKALGRHTNGP